MLGGNMLSIIVKLVFSQVFALVVKCLRKVSI